MTRRATYLAGVIEHDENATDEQIEADITDVMEGKRELDRFEVVETMEVD